LSYAVDVTLLTERARRKLHVYVPDICSRHSCTTVECVELDTEGTNACNEYNAKQFDKYWHEAI
jgi:hypothetical protein